MKVPTHLLTGSALDWAVMKCMGLEPTIEPDGYLHVGNVRWQPSHNWHDGGPIIEREIIMLDYDAAHDWEARDFDSQQILAHGRTPLVAAMRCYVASKLGNEADIPEELAACNSVESLT